MRAPLALWSGFVLAFTTLSYTLRFTEGNRRRICSTNGRPSQAT